MILDAQLQFSDDQALTATAVSTNVIDLGADRNIGLGTEGLSVMVISKVAMAGTSPTLAVTVQTDDNSAFSSAATVTTSATLTAFAAGTKLVLPIPADLSTERYLRLNFTMGGTTPTVTVDAFLHPTSLIENQAYYADAISIT